MSKRYVLLSDLPDYEIADLLDGVQSEGQLLSDEVEFSTSLQETNFFTSIARQLAEEDISYEQATILTSLFVCVNKICERNHQLLS